VWLSNARTEKKTLSIIGVSFEHDLSEGTVPVVTTKKLAWKAAIAEMLGYIRGYKPISSVPSLCGLSSQAWFLLAFAFQVLHPNSLNCAALW
jgi:thymidylate synthase